MEVQVDVVASYMSHFQKQQNTRFVGIPAVHAHGHTNPSQYSQCSIKLIDGKRRFEGNTVELVEVLEVVVQVDVKVVVALKKSITTSIEMRRL